MVYRKENLNNDELAIALVEAQQAIWELNSKLEFFIKERERLLISLNDKRLLSCSDMEILLLEANQQNWELNSRLEVCIREREFLQARYNRPLCKIIAERVRNGLREFRKKIGLSR